MSAIKSFMLDQVEIIREVLGLPEYKDCSMVHEQGSLVIIRCPVDTNIKERISTYLGCALSWKGIDIQIAKGRRTEHQYIRAFLKTI